MASRDARFDGSIPELYDRHMGPMLFEPYAIDMAQRLPPKRLATEAGLLGGATSAHVLTAWA